jgi:hypothetical protein
MARVVAWGALRSHPGWASTGQADGNRYPARPPGTPEETSMWQPWNTVRTWWKHVMRVVVVAVVVCVSACTTPTGSSSNPSGQPPEGGPVRPRGPSGY